MRTIIVNEHEIRTAPDIRVDRPGAAVGRGSLRAQLAARMFARDLDGQLAVGWLGPAGSALAIRAARLESEKERHTIARALRRVVVDSRLVRPPGAPTVPVHRQNIAAAEEVIERITLRLHAPRPVSATGMARLRRVLSDGGGPLYAGGRGSLDGRLRAALAAL
jgi:hypothetical protein